MRHFKSKTEKKEWLAKLLEKLAKDVRGNVYGEDGCGINPEGYGLSDVISDAMDGHEPEYGSQKQL